MCELGHHTACVFLLLLIITIRCSCADSFTVRVLARRLAAARGHSVVLGCEFSPNLGQNPDLTSLVVTWQREDQRVVHSFYYEQDQLHKQDSAYRNRTALFVTELSKGNASLRIDNVGVQDAGLYLCTVSTSKGTGKADVHLDYGAFFTEPRLTISVHSSDIMVQYKTEGFPVPEVMWKGEHGQNISNHTNMSMQSNEMTGLTYITSSYTGPNTPLNFSFILKNQLLHQYLERHVSYIGEPKSCFNKIITPTVFSFILFVVVVILLWMYCKKKKLCLLL